MAALNFPTTNLVAGVTEYSANGTTYLWDGVKWVGRTAGGAAGTNSIQNGVHTVQVDSGGNLVLPAFAMPNTVGTTGQVLKWPASGTTLAWANDNNSGGGADLGKFKIVTDSGVAFLTTTDDADGYGGYDISITPSEMGSAFIRVPNNANAEIGAPLTINSIAANSSVQINTDWADPWIFGANGVLIAPDDIIAGSVGSGGRFIQDCDNGTTSMRWINVEVDDDSTQLIRAYSGDPDGEGDSDERAQIKLNWQDEDRSGLTIRAFDRTDANNTVEHDWIFQGDGNLTLPLGGNILNNDGSVYGGGGNANTGDITFDGNQIGVDGNNGEIKIRSADGNDYSYTWQTPQRWEAYAENDEDGDHMAWAWIKADMEDGINNPKVFIETVAGNTGVEQRWTFGADGNLQLPQGSTISDQATSVDLTVGRVSESAYWYNLFGDTGATGVDNYANTAINGSVVHDSGGNVYVLGSTVSWNGGFDGNNNLFLKYSPLGELLWRRTWTDDNGLNCGSYNASLRYIEANVDLGTQDTIVWAAQVTWDRISYVGTMDMEGNLVDQYGNARPPTRLDNFVVTDLEWTGNINELDSAVTVVGQQYLPGPGYHFPAVAGVDLANAAVYGTTTVMPDGTNLNYGSPNNTPQWVNQFKAAVTIPAWQSNPAVGALVGSYYDGDYGHAMVALSGNGPPETYGIGVDNYSEDNIIGEDICADANGNVYIIVNNITSNYAMLIKASAVTLDNGFAVWQLKLGSEDPDDNFYATAVAYDSGYVYVLGQFYQDNIDDTDAMLVKINISNGNIVWSRRIGSPGEDGVNFLGGPGQESSSGISVYDNLITISFATEARTPGLNLGPPELNTVTLQYPTDGSITGTYGDFVISDSVPGYDTGDLNITTLTTALGGEPVNSSFAALQATTATVGTGWTNTQWDLDQNREVYPTQTFKFMTDGSFDTQEIKHTSTVKITANTVSGTNASTWTFQNNDGLRFPDGSVQYGAYIQTEMSLDGGSAATVYNIISVPPVADGGGSASRFGNYDPVYDGSSGDNYVLDGGGA